MQLEVVGYRLAEAEENATCCHCGRAIKHVFEVESGRPAPALWGGDCLATVTGDDSTRAIWRNISKQLSKRDTPERLIVRPAVRSGRAFQLVAFFPWGDRIIAAFDASTTSPAKFIAACVAFGAEVLDFEGRPA